MTAASLEQVSQKLHLNIEKKSGAPCPVLGSQVQKDRELLERMMAIKMDRAWSISLLGKG